VQKYDILAKSRSCFSNRFLKLGANFLRIIRKLRSRYLLQSPLVKKNERRISTAIGAILGNELYFCELCNKQNTMRKIEHIGIAVKNLEVSNLIFEKLFGAPSYKQEEVASEGVKTSFFMNGPNKIELLEATNSESPIAKFLEKKGEGIHHIAFDVEDIVSEIARLQSEGFVVLNEIPKKGADNKLVAFLHPKSTNGVLIELCQEIKD
jgi:methylmalonyl-CoA/ethylmalonyl-CoA epimerase